MKNKAKYIVMLSPIIWGINPTMMKIANKYLTPTTTTFFRLLIAVTIMATVSFAKKLITKDNIVQLIKDTKYMMLFFTIFQFFYGLGISMIPASISSVILGMLPVLVIIITTLFGYEKVTTKVVLSVALSVIGVVIIVFAGQTSTINHISATGVILVLLAETGYACFTIQSKTVSQKHPTIAVIAASTAATALVFFVLSFNNLMTVEFSKLPLEAWLALLYCGAFAVGIANLIWVWSSGYLKSSTLSLYSNISPVVGIITGLIILSEKITGLQGIGIAVIFISILLSQSKQKKISK